MGYIGLLFIEEYILVSERTFIIASKMEGLNKGKSLVPLGKAYGVLHKETRFTRHSSFISIICHIVIRKHPIIMTFQNHCLTWQNLASRQAFIYINIYIYI